MWTTILWALFASSFAAAMPRPASRGAFPADGILPKPWKIANFKVAATLDFEPFKLTNVRLECIADPATFAHDNYTCGLNFNWFDPNSVKYNNVSSTSCNATWSWTPGTTVGGDDNSLDTPYDPCFQEETYGTYFAMRLMEFVEPTNFTLQLARHYHDPDNFTAPWDYVTTFSQPTLRLPVVRDTLRNVTLFSHGPIDSIIVGLSS